MLSKNRSVAHRVPPPYIPTQIMHADHSAHAARLQTPQATPTNSGAMDKPLATKPASCLSSFANNHSSLQTRRGTYC